ncbi:hypothetical protein [Gordonia zhaorongruii]|uniref:hypothetical protein n=1 Tax=Gordonia zhaorongruii TaxID=2597659 RepID=UPI0010463D3A|nr:hypothetical protein [Gordonia zhaorongruii]
MFVLTADQRGSRRDRDRVPDVLDRYSGARTLRPFDRTAGDELQAVFDDPHDLSTIAVELAASGRWSVGIGIGDVSEPLPESTRAGRGPAFESARAAVEQAKHDRLRLRVVGSSPTAAHAQTAALLLVETMSGRSTAGREVVGLMRTGSTQSAAANRLGISPQAVSARLQAAAWDLQTPGEELFAALLSAAEGDA